MSCVYPIDAWRAKRKNKSGKRGIVFNPREGYTDQSLQVPCGKCVGCAADRARVWAVRMHHEASQHECSSFITLTYANPAPVSLNKLHLQLFFKRLRHVTACRYFACGEYGSLTNRPHYHAVLFGTDFLGGAYQINETLHGNPILDKVWGHGFASAGAVTIQSCMYVAGYTTKKLGQSDTFNLMSRRPGIGHTWIEKYREQIARTGTVVIEGKEFSIPRRYIDWYEEDFEEVKRERAAYFQHMTPDQAYNRRLNLPAAEVMYKERTQLRQELI